jgi:hypothetical protein
VPDRCVIQPVVRPAHIRGKPRAAEFPIPPNRRFRHFQDVSDLRDVEPAPDPKFYNMRGSFIHRRQPVEHNGDGNVMHFGALGNGCMEKKLLMLRSPLTTVFDEDASHLATKKGYHVDTIGCLYRSAFDQPEESLMH